MSVHFSLVTTTINKNFLLKIREFILNLLDEHFYLLGSTTKLINILDKKSNKGHRAVSLLDITQIDFVYNILIPYLESLEFRAKKYKDFLEFKTLAMLIF